MSDSSALSVRQTVGQLVELYEQSCRDVRQAFALISGVEERCNAALTLDHYASVRVSTRDWHGESWDDVERAIDRLRMSFWASLVERLEIRRFLSVKRAAELDKMLDGKSSETFPEITIENVMGFARGFELQAADMLTEAVEEVFSWLRPERSQYKTNSELEVPRKVVLTWMVEKNWRGVGDGFRVQYGRAQQRVTALQNVFSSLDGKGSIAHSHYGELYDAINATGKDGRFSCEYFEGRAFRNGNLHLTIKRADLLAKFNQIAGGKRLRPSTEAA